MNVVTTHTQVASTGGRVTVGVPVTTTLTSLPPPAAKLLDVASPTHELWVADYLRDVVDRLTRHSAQDACLVADAPTPGTRTTFVNVIRARRIEMRGKRMCVHRPNPLHSWLFLVVGPAYQGGGRM